MLPCSALVNIVKTCSLTITRNQRAGREAEAAPITATRSPRVLRASAASRASQQEITRDCCMMEGGSLKEHPGQMKSRPTSHRKSTPRTFLLLSRIQHIHKHKILNLPQSLNMEHLNPKDDIPRLPMIVRTQCMVAKCSRSKRSTRSLGATEAPWLPWPLQDAAVGSWRPARPRPRSLSNFGFQS